MHIASGSSSLEFSIWDSKEVLTLESTQPYELLLVLSHADEKTQMEARIAQCLCSSMEEAADIVDTLMLHKVLIETVQGEGGKADLWTNSNWLAAAPLHFTSFDYPFVDYETQHSLDVGRMKDYVDQNPVPSIYHEFPERIGLLTAEQVSSQAHHSIGSFYLGLLSLTQTAFQQVSTRHWPPQGDFVQKIIPSGGARHPTEVYLSMAKDGEQASLLHYSVKHDAFELLSEELKDTPPCRLFLTALVRRPMWRYRDPRSSRVIYADIGHALSVLKHLGDQVGINFRISSMPWPEELVVRLQNFEIAELPMLALEARQVRGSSDS